ncbi:MAG: P-loop NTPase [Candidatus Methanofastidiosia archaeon]
MIISIISGKGGTGKTTIAINLALSLEKCILLDCDVEEPDANLYLKIELSKVKDVKVLNPEVDLERCTFCGKCSDFCQYNALAVLPSAVLVFPKICNGCGGCKLVCEADAIKEVPRIVGVIERGKKEDIIFYRGLLDIGEARAPPIIKAMKKLVNQEDTIIMDAPPGTSCPTVEVLMKSDYAIIVTEPTPFGKHDLELVVGLVRELKIPFGVIINKDGIGDDDVENFLKKEEIPILVKIPHSLEIAKLGSEGIPLCLEDESWKSCFNDIFKKICAGMRK